ncbi:MAG: hypothetical protein ACLPSF_06520 [Methylocella sp.]
MRKNTRKSLAAALILLGATTTGALAQDPNFQMEEQDCQGDAMRLCGPEIPDHAKILACLQYYQADISPACRSIVAPGNDQGRQ